MTFGDESAVSSNFAASVVSIVLILVLWGSFTGSKILPSFVHVPGAFQGETEFTYTAETESGLRDDAAVQVSGWHYHSMTFINNNRLSFSLAK